MKTSTVIILAIAGFGLLVLIWKLAKPAPQAASGIGAQVGGVLGAVGGIVGTAQQTAYGITTGGIKEIGGEMSTAAGEVKNFFGSLF